ncbi:MmcQ/YjbR family DNA-binding protein [Flexivirga caeni]|uniref:MmcQ/YjbR family DNA-binding protein n=1 Tax=Flexivirga caeni TaxID=2294115 RepID=A0A3M9MFV6_9MICO|nr:MmcQ/YjbR family DNA-binding protein [Flexivirga caeni]RNI24432.1 MmcQ/YjbR family DNA-binding protein [Flexivirga caeni]
MATWDDVRRIVADLPEVDTKVSWGHLMWRVKGTSFVWERPLHTKDRADLGADAPDGEILGVRVPDDGAKEALLADGSGIYFTIPHFNGYPAVLVRLDEIDVAELTEIVTEAWLDRAPKRLAAAYLAEHPLDPERP